MDQRKKESNIFQKALFPSGTAFFVYSDHAPSTSIPLEVQEYFVSKSNPFRRSVGSQIDVLRRANKTQCWGIPEADIDRLAETAPAWPKGRLAFRSLRIRFGEGDDGVTQTFNAHMKRVFRAFGKHSCGVAPWVRAGAYAFEGGFQDILDELTHRIEPPIDRGSIERLRLHVGNHTHRPTLEWFVMDLERDLKEYSLADELLVFTWLFPSFIKKWSKETDPTSLCLVAWGYELNAPELNMLKERGEFWRHVPYVRWDHVWRKVRINAFRVGPDRVPVSTGSEAVTDFLKYAQEG